MRKLSKAPAASLASRDDDEPTGAGNYAQRFIDYARSHGGMHVIRRHPGVGFPATHARWKAWIDWMQTHGIPTKFAIGHGVVTVPAEWPEDFDSYAEPSNRDFRFAPKLLVSDARRRQLAAEFRRAVSEIERRNYDPRRPDNPVVPETPEQTLERKRAAYSAALSTPLSDRARAGIGLPPIPPAAPDWQDEADVAF